MSCFEQAAVGSQGSRGTINHGYSTEEMLKASMSNKGRINVLLCYCLVGTYVGLPLGVAVSPGGAWYGDDGPHLAGIL